MISNVRVRVFIEGMELIDFNGLTFQFSENSPAILSLKTSRVKGISSLLPTTLCQVFIEENGVWFIFFEGELLGRRSSLSSSHTSNTLTFKSISGIYDRTLHSKFDLANPITGMTSDILYGNIGLMNENKTSDTLTVLKNTTELSNNFLALNSWRKWIEAASAEGNGEGTEKFYKEMFQNIAFNNPYVKIITKSLRLNDRIKIFSNDQIFKPIAQLDAFEGLRERLVIKGTTETYKSMILKIAKLTLSKVLHIGIPLSIDGNMTEWVILPQTDFLVPPTFNILYEDEFDNYQLIIDHSQEPTRALNIGYTSDIMAAMGIKGLPATPQYMAPVKEFSSSKDSENNYHLKFTEEEKIRGINPIIISKLPAVAKAYLGYMNEEGKGFPDLAEAHFFEKEAEKVSTDKVNKTYASVMLFLTEHLYYMRRLESRGDSQITVPYINMNWMVGFSGVIFTKEHGPIIYNFQGMSIDIDASGRASTTLVLNSPRLLNDMMDVPTPDWYEPYLKKENIGKDFYSKFNGDSITSYTKTNTNEKAVLKLLEMDKIPYSKRQRKLMTSSAYCDFLRINSVDGFPNPAVTEYRKASLLNALQISDTSSTTEYLECAFVYERGVKVKDWLGLEVDLKEFKKIPPQFNEEELISKYARQTGENTSESTDSVGGGNSTSRPGRIPNLSGSLCPSKEMDNSLGNLENMILITAKNSGVDPALLKAVALAESGAGTDKRMYTNPQAKGLMQFTPKTATRFDVDVYDYFSSINGASKYLEFLLNRYSQYPPATKMMYAVAAYNTGENNMDRYISNGIPGGVPDHGNIVDQTPSYVEKVFAYYNYLKTKK